MNRVITGQSAAEQWQHLVRDAETYQGLRLDYELEAYLVMVLLRFTRAPHVLSSVLGVEYMMGCEAFGTAQHEKLRDVADKCLLVSGLFPGVARHRHVSADYYVHIGQDAYGQLAALLAHRTSVAILYDQLESHFIELVDCLHCVRALGDEKDVH